MMNHQYGMGAGWALIILAIVAVRCSSLPG